MQPTLQLHHGVQRLTPSALLYVPKSLPPSAPLIVLLHGAGGDAGQFIEDFRSDADREGALLLAVQSSGRTWPHDRQSDSPDIANIDAAVATAQRSASIDKSRVIVVGFSDGASFALTVGLADPATFRGIVALSAAFALAPPQIDPTQRIFISHGRTDPVLPFANVRDQLVPALKRAGYQPEVRWFNGGHAIDPDALKAGIRFALGEAPGSSHR